MSKPEGFAARWSRRKREAAEESAPVEPAEAGTSDSPQKGGTSDSAPPEASDAEPTPDLSALPSLESITATTDIRPFLAAGVPSQLRNAALRRVWSTDPVIRDFKGLAELDWDFNAPDSMAGFGPLQVTDALRRFVLDTITSQQPAQTAQEPEPEARPNDEVAVAGRPESELPTESTPANDDHADQVIASSEITEVSSSENMTKNVEISRAVIRRGHGGAIPR